MNCRSFAALLLIAPEIYSSIAGLGLLGAIGALQLAARRHAQAGARS